MTAISVSAPFPILTDIDGSPLDAGHVYIGQANLDPVAFPKSVYWDASLTTPAAQPIRTSGGYPVRNGSPARIYTDGDYSIRINNKNGTLVYSSPAATDRMDSAFVGYDGGTVQDVLDAVTGPSGAASVGYMPAGTGAVATTVQSKLREIISSTEYATITAWRDAVSTYGNQKSFYYLPSSITSEIVISNLSDCAIFVFGNAVVNANIVTAITLSQCVNCKVYFTGKINCNSKAEVGVKLDKCTNTKVFGINVSNAYANVSTGTANGIRIVNQCVNCEVSNFSVSNTVAFVSRGVYVGFNSGESNGIKIYNGIIIDTLGDPSGSAGGDSIHVQQTGDVNCLIENIQIVGWSWRALKIQAPGVTVRNIKVSSSNTYSAESVVTTFFPVIIDGIYGSASKVGQAVVIDGDDITSGEVVVKNVFLSLSGENTNQALQYFIRASSTTGNIDNLIVSGCSISGDANYDRAFDLLSAVKQATVIGNKFLSTNASINFAASNITASDNIFGVSGTYAEISGSNCIFSSNKVYGQLLVSGAANVVSNNTISHTGNNLLDMRSTSSKCIVSLNKVMNFTGNQPIILRAGSAGNRLVYNDYSTNSATSPVIYDLSGGANTIINF